MEGPPDNASLFVEVNRVVHEVLAAESGKLAFDGEIGHGRQACVAMQSTAKSSSVQSRELSENMRAISADAFAAI